MSLTAEKHRGPRPQPRSVGERPGLGNGRAGFAGPHAARLNRATPRSGRGTGARSRSTGPRLPDLSKTTPEIAQTTIRASVPGPCRETTPQPVSVEGLPGCPIGQSPCLSRPADRQARFARPGSALHACSGPLRAAERISLISRMLLARETGPLTLENRQFSASTRKRHRLVLPLSPLPGVVVRMFSL